MTDLIVQRVLQTRYATSEQWDAITESVRNNVEIEPDEPTLPSTM